jgi:hypothetical protein
MIAQFIFDFNNLLNKLKMKLFILLAFCVTLIACDAIKELPIETVDSRNNTTYKVSYLFEHDGCKVYRFEDKGNIVYFSNCNGSGSIMKTDTTNIKYINGNKKN